MPVLRRSDSPLSLLVATQDSTLRLIKVQDLDNVSYRSDEKKAGKLSMARLRVAADLRLPLPGLVIGIDDIKMPSRKRKSLAGPFLIISRACGLALDAKTRLDPGSIPHLWPPHARPNQLWFLRSSGYEGEAFILSAAASNLALDSTTPAKHYVQLREIENEAWQRWRILDAADGVCYLLQSAHNGKFLTAGGDSEKGWSPWFENRHGQVRQQWIIAAPHGHIGSK